MANKARTTDKKTLEELGVNIEDFDGGAALAPALEAAYAQLGISDDGADATIYVSIIDTKTQKEARIWDGPVEDWDMKTLAQKYGSGDYRVKLYTRIPTGQKVQQQNKIISWRLSAEDDARLKMLRDNPQALPNAGVVVQQAAQGITREDLIAAVQAAQSKGPTLTELVGVVATLAAALKPAAPVQPATPSINPLDLVRMAMTAMAQGRSSGSGGDDDGDTPRRGANSNDIWLRLIDKALGPLLEVAAGRMPTTAALPAPETLIGGAGSDTITGAPGGESNQQQAGTEMNAKDAMKLRMGLRFLVSQAEQNADTATYATVAIDAIGEDEAEKFLALPDPVAMLGEIEPEVLKHRAWFSQMLNDCREELKDDGDGGGESGNA